ncbi:phage tail sheath subtilisin-like domain-containing protein [Desulfobulbus elongatus]|uniref:phage tail sheath subtilisin-like domain-containing protein n=1 Tax=Desulfobulbus elongatus TaxID=53332 RepID=UPI0004849BC6|nr:phage tail sheath subtilisin-like domain-containing protein [Desulfobulbus elongatus]
MASKNISFDSIPASIRKPGKYFEFNYKLAVRTLPANEQRVLIVGQRLEAGSVAALVPTTVFSDAQAAAWFGTGSMAHLMCRAAITANAYLDLTVVALDDGAGATATGTVTIANAASSAGTLKLYVGDRAIEIAIASAQTAVDVAAALKAEIDTYGDLPVTATVAEAVVTLTARNKGTVGNQIGLAYELTAGATTVTLSGARLSGGTLDPDIEDALAVVFAEQYHVVITPYNDQTALTALRTHLDVVSGPLEQRAAIGVYGYDGALAGATTLAGQINSGRITGAYLRGTRSPAWELAAAYGAVIAFEEDPARPLNTLALTGIHAPVIDQRLSRTEQENCLRNGVTPLEVGPGEVVQIVRAITTYTLDPQGIADIALLDLTTIRTLDYTRKACRERISLRFPREKLSSRTPDRVRAELLDVLFKMEDLEFLEEVAANKDGLIVERDLQDPNRLNAKIPVDVVNGLHVFAGRIDLYL